MHILQMKEDNHCLMALTRIPEGKWKAGHPDNKAKTGEKLGKKLAKSVNKEERG